MDLNPLNWSVFYEELPADEMTAGKLNQIIGEISPHLQEGGWLLFAKRHGLSLDHFLVKSAEGKTPFGQIVKEGFLPQFAEFLQPLGQNLTRNHFLQIAQEDLEEGPKTAFDFAAGLGGHLMQVREALEPSGEGFLPEDFARPSRLIDALRTRQLAQVNELLNPCGHQLTVEHFWGAPLYEAAINHLDYLTDFLKTSGQRALTLHDCLQKDEKGNTALHGAALGLCFSKLLTLLDATEEKPTVEHLTLENEAGETPLSLLAEHGDLKEVFEPAHWINRVEEMDKVFAKLSMWHRPRIGDYEALRETVVQQSTAPSPKISAKALAALEGAHYASEIRAQRPVLYARHIGH